HTTHISITGGPSEDTTNDNPIEGGLLFGSRGGDRRGGRSTSASPRVSSAVDTSSAAGISASLSMSRTDLLITGPNTPVIYSLSGLWSRVSRTPFRGPNTSLTSSVTKTSRNAEARPISDPQIRLDGKRPRLLLGPFLYLTLRKGPS